MSQYLTIIFRKSLATGVVPKSWKRAKIIPLFKSGDKQLLNNYRPISLTPYSCKLLEHIIHKHIMEFLEENNILTNAQHGFRHGFSTLTQLSEFVHDIASALDSGNRLTPYSLTLLKPLIVCPTKNFCLNWMLF